MYTETESTTFHMLAPQKGTYLLDIFSAKYPNYEMCQKKEATKYINVCRFRVNCTGVDKVNVPLPECAPGKCNSSILKFPCPKFWKFRSRFFFYTNPPMGCLYDFYIDFLAYRLIGLQIYIFLSNLIV